MPSFDNCDRTKMLESTQNELLKKSLNKYQNILTQGLTEMRQSWKSKIDEVKYQI